MSIHLGLKYTHAFCPFRELYPHTSSPDLFVVSRPMFQLCSRSLIIQPNHGHSPWISIYSQIWPFFLLSKTNKMLNILLTGRIILYPCSRNVPEEDFNAELSISLGACISCKTFCSPYLNIHSFILPSSNIKAVSLKSSYPQRIP